MDCLLLFIFFTQKPWCCIFRYLTVCVNSSYGDKQLNISASLCNLSDNLDLKWRQRSKDRGKTGVVFRSIVWTQHTSVWSGWWEVCEVRQRLFKNRGMEEWNCTKTSASRDLGFLFVAYGNAISVLVRKNNWDGVDDIEGLMLSFNRC